MHRCVSRIGTMYREFEHLLGQCMETFAIICIDFIVSSFTIENALLRCLAGIWAKKYASKFSVLASEPLTYYSIFSCARFFFEYS